MALTVGELAKLTGVTVRALHHYDEIGLVRPSGRTAAGYRLYRDADVLRLHQVLILRELGMPLEEIAAAIRDTDHEDDRLRQHRQVLVSRRARLDAMIAGLDARLAKGGMDMTGEELAALFDGFDPSTYHAEAEGRWGEGEAFKESTRRSKGYTQADWARFKAEAQANNARLAALMRDGRTVDDPEVQAAVAEHRLLIDRWFYPCPVAMHKALGAMYVDDPRFRESLDRIAGGYARFLRDAIAAS
jgi:DNA-binding transcriptional MerR regulator